MIEKNKKEKKRTSLLLGMMEEKFYPRYTGEHRQRYLRKSRVDITSLSWTLCGEGDGERKEKR